jgi:hypothetical protein
MKGHEGHKSFALFHEPAQNPKTELVLIFIEAQNPVACDAASFSCPEELGRI